MATDTEDEIGELDKEMQADKATVAANAAAEAAQEADEEMEGTQEAAPAPAIPKYEELPERFALPDGSIVSREDFFGLAAEYPDAKKWKKTNAERGEQLNKAQAQLEQYRWGVEFQNLAARDPVFAAAISKAYAERYGGGNGTQGATSQTIDVEPDPQWKDDPGVVEARRIAIETARKVQSGVAQTIEERIGPMMATVQGLQQRLGSIVGREELGQVQEAFKEHGITATPELLARVQDVSVRTGLPLFDSSGPDAYKIVAYDHIAKKPTDAALKVAPNRTIPAGSGRSPASPSATASMGREELAAFRTYKRYDPKATPEQFRKQVRAAMTHAE